MLRRGLFATVLASVTLACSPDEAPRILSVSITGQTPDAQGPYRVVARVDDDRRLDLVELVYEVEGSDAPSLTLPLDATEATRWAGSLGPQPLGTVIRYRGHARAGDGEVYWPDLNSQPLTLIVGNVPSLPQLYAVWPDRGPTTGGTPILLVGQDFRDGLMVSFSGGLATSVQVLSRTQATAVTPPGPPGPVPVGLRQPDGGATSNPGAFTYFPAPEILSVEPARGPTAGGTPVTIRGRHFPATGAVFLFGGVPATNVRILSEVEALAITPAHSPGPVTVRVEHPTDGFGEKSEAYEYIPPPEVLSVTPPRGSDLGGTQVTVVGRFFQVGARLRFDDRETFDVVFISETELRAGTPAHPQGFSDVTVTNPDLQFGTLPGGYLFVGPPRIDSVVEPYAAASGGATVRVLGANFEPGTLIEVNLGGQSLPLICTFVSDAELSCRTPVVGTPGVYDVTVTNPDGRSDRLLGGLSFFTLTAVNPSRGPASGGTSVRVTGQFLPDSVRISFVSAQANCQWVNASRVDCITPPGPANQFVDVGALPSGAGQVPAVLPQSYFYVPPPQITGLSPEEGPLHGGTAITISGNFFQPGATVTIGGNACQNVVVVNEQTITCVVPAGLPGQAEVVVTNPDGQSGRFLGFDYVPVEFTPNWSLIDGFSNLTITGVEFTPGAVVRIDGAVVPGVQFIDSHQLRVTAPSRISTGSVQLRVEIPGRPSDIAPELFSYRVYRDRSTPTMFGSDETSDIQIADLDGDGDQDLLYINGSVSLPGRSEVLENLGNGSSFLSRPLGINEVGNEGGICDTNGDGLPELIWGTSGSASPYFRNRRNFNFLLTPLATDPADAFEAGFFDIDGDGDCDIVNLAISGPDTVLVNNGSGAFRVVNNAIPHEPGFEHDHKVDVGDFNRDGIPDLVVVVDDVNFGFPPSQRHRIYLGNGDNTFREDQLNRPLLETIHGDIYDVRVGDVDLDGDLDLVMPNFNRPPILLLNNGSGLFSLSTNRIPQDARPDSSLVLADVEGDGDLDLVLISLEPNVPSALFLNDGRGFYFRAFAGEPQGARTAYRAAMGDLSSDGRNDLIFGTVFDDNQMFFAEE